MGTVTITHCAGKENVNADALSRNPCSSSDANGIGEGEVQVAAVTNNQTTPAPAPDSDNVMNITDMLNLDPSDSDEVHHDSDFAEEQQKDQGVLEIANFLTDGKLPSDQQRAKKVALQGNSFTIIDNILYYVDSKNGNRKRAVVPKQLQKHILEENHSGLMAGHFGVSRMYGALCHSWWWEGMYTDVYQYCHNCQQCAISGGGSRRLKPPLHTIPVQRAFQIMGVDVLELPKTKRGNQYAIVFQDFLTKWPMVFATPDQKAIRIAGLLAEEIVYTYLWCTRMFIV